MVKFIDSKKYIIDCNTAMRVLIMRASTMRAPGRDSHARLHGSSIWSISAILFNFEL